jgi:hypothetical protein
MVEKKVGPQGSVTLAADVRPYFSTSEELTGPSGCTKANCRPGLST